MFPIIRRFALLATLAFTTSLAFADADAWKNNPNLVKACEELQTKGFKDISVSLEETTYGPQAKIELSKIYENGKCKDQNEAFKQLEVIRSSLGDIKTIVTANGFDRFAFTGSIGKGLLKFVIPRKGLVAKISEFSQEALKFITNSKNR
jgi:hypothetical protein